MATEIVLRPEDLKRGVRVKLRDGQTGIICYPKAGGDAQGPDIIRKWMVSLDGLGEGSAAIEVELEEIEQTIPN